MTQTIYGKIKVHPTEIIECVGETKNGRELSIFISANEFKGIAKFLQFTDHLGHAYWHYCNPDVECPCPSCKTDNDQE